MIRPTEKYYCMITVLHFINDCTDHQAEEEGYSFHAYTHLKAAHSLLEFYVLVPGSGDDSLSDTLY